MPSTACGRPGRPTDYSGGRIERVDLATGAIETLYTHCDGHMLRGPNDIVFDAHGGFYFTDLGKTRAREMDRGAVYYAKADGSLIKVVANPTVTANGCALSPDGKQALLRRDGSRRGCGRWTSWRPARCSASRGPHRTAVACSAAPAASISASTAWPSTAPATSASPR